MTGRGTDMLKYLTQKFRSQSLNEIELLQGKEEDDHDSGTESDEDIQDEDDLEDDISGCSHQFSCSCMNRLGSTATTHEISEHSLDSISCTSDYERQSLDFERHSSEEELSTIHNEITTEKRKWSQFYTGSCDSSGSVDEEVKEYMLKPRPVLFSSSPPTDGVVDEITCQLDGSKTNEVVFKTINDHTECENVCDLKMNENESSHVHSHSVSSKTKQSASNTSTDSSISPRKRLRQVSSLSSGNTSQKSVMRRPSLDFEKMQKNAVKKQCVHNVGKAKVVKVKTLTGSNAVTSKCLSDPSIYSFRSISTVRYGQLTPVEQPPCAY